MPRAMKRVNIIVMSKPRIISVKMTKTRQDMRQASDVVHPGHATPSRRTIYYFGIFISERISQVIFDKTQPLQSMSEITFSEPPVLIYFEIKANRKYLRAINCAKMWQITKKR